MCLSLSNNLLRPLKQLWKPSTAFYAQHLMLVNLKVINAFVLCVTLLEIDPSVLDHVWTQDSLIFPITSEYKLDLILAKDSQQLGFELLKKKNTCLEITRCH